MLVQNEGKVVIGLGTLSGAKSFRDILERIWLIF